MLNLKRFPYKNIRPIQKNILETIKNNWNNNDYIVIEAPPGTGKSAIAKTILDSNNKGYLLTITKQLQDQYINDFKDGTITDIKGRNNYKCIKNEKLNCENGLCNLNKELIKTCKDSGFCPYYSRRQEALRSNIAMSSYSYFLKAWDSSTFWDTRDVIVLDECHCIEEQLVNVYTLHLSPSELNEKYGILENVDIGTFTTLFNAPTENGYDANKKWILKLKDTIHNRRLELLKETTFGQTKNPDELTEDELNELLHSNSGYYNLNKFYNKLVKFIQSPKDDWIIEPKDNGLIIIPLKVDNIFRTNIDKYRKRGGKIVFMSATILDVKGFCKDLGLPRERTLVLRANSTFNSSMSPIIYKPTCKMGYEDIDKNSKKIIEQIKLILNENENKKGIIHCGNYKLAKLIENNIKDPRLIFKDDFETNNDIINKHIKSKLATVLVSPSLTTGVDLKGDLSRFQIIIKMPFTSLLDSRTKLKIELEQDWYICNMFRTLIQACGRSTRSENDWSVTYILDPSFFYWIQKYKKWFNKQFLNRIRWK